MKNNSKVLNKLRGKGPGVLLVPTPAPGVKAHAPGSGAVSGSGGVEALLAECAKLNQTMVRFFVLGAFHPGTGI